MAILSIKESLADQISFYDVIDDFPAIKARQIKC